MTQRLDHLVEQLAAAPSAIGLAAGGVTAATSATAEPRAQTFLIASNLAPSSLLDD